jgi:hypothetical protein
VIPSYILHKWDLEPYVVCDNAYLHIQRNFHNPVFDIELQNPQLYSLVPALWNVKVWIFIFFFLLPLFHFFFIFFHYEFRKLFIHFEDLREQLVEVVAFLKTCKVGKKLLLNVRKVFHLIESVHAYSLKDFLAVEEAKLEQVLESYLIICLRHITRECEVFSFIYLFTEFP